MKIKAFFGYVVAGMIGAAAVVGLDRVTEQEPSQPEARSVDMPKATLASDREVVSSMRFPTNFNEAAKTATPAVVKIKSIQTTASAQQMDNNPFSFLFGDMDEFFGPQMGAGSGVIISSDGYIVTNNHVVENGDEFEVILDDKRTFKAEKVGTDNRVDLAVLKIEATGLPILDYADSDEVEVGDWVLAIGNPFEYLTSTVTAGIVSAKGRDIDILNTNGKIESFIQTDAAVNPGNSGGALVDLDGNLVGINTAIATQTGTFSGYSFAIPVNLMKKIAEDIIQYGSYRRAMLGVNIAPLDQPTADQLGVKVSAGVLVDGVRPGGAAEQAGILPLDVIARVDDREVNSIPELQELIGGKRVNEIVDLEIIRKGKRKELSVRLKEE